MRTTVTLADDVAAAVEQVRKQKDIGLSEAVNELIRQGLSTRAEREPFRQRTERLGLRIDVANVAEALEILKESDPG